MQNKPIKRDEIMENLQQETEKIITFYEEYLTESSCELERRDALIQRLKVHNLALRKSTATALNMLQQALGKGLH